MSDHSNAANVEGSAVSPAIAGTSRPPLWADLAATLFRIGSLRPGPGTWASTATVLIWALASSQIPASYHLGATIAAAMSATIIGIPAATRVARASRLKDPQSVVIDKDPQSVVIDEVAGQLVSLIGVPLSWKTFLAGLILFRVFDILKPPPVRQLERLPEGFGIVVDDLGAGLYALIVMHLMLRIHLLIG